MENNIEMSLTIEYRNKQNGMLYIRFDADQDQDNNGVRLYCHDDDSGDSDVDVSWEDLKENYTEVNRYMEES